MPRWPKVSLDVPASNASGTPYKVTNDVDSYVQFGGTYSATLTIEGTINGTDWEAAGTGSSGDIIQVLGLFDQIRITTSAYVSGTPTATLEERTS